MEKGIKIGFIYGWWPAHIWIYVQSANQLKLVCNFLLGLFSSYASPLCPWRHLRFFRQTLAVHDIPRAGLLGFSKMQIIALQADCHHLHPSITPPPHPYIYIYFFLALVNGELANTSKNLNEDTERMRSEGKGRQFGICEIARTHTHCECEYV